MDKTFIPEELRGKDIYKILEISKKDINKENITHIIRRQYLKLAVKLHPDKQKGRNVKTQNSSGICETKEEFNIVKSAYEFLSNNTLRKKYNSYILQNIKRKEPLNHNTSLRRNIDNNKFLFQRYQKEVYKNKLEERERATAFNNKKENTFSKSFDRNGSNDLDKIKKENEAFLRKKQMKEIKKQKKNDDSEQQKKNKAEDECKAEEEMLEIYLDNYDQNINFLENCINENFFFHFFFGFNFLDSSLHLNNEKDTEKNSNSKKVGYILFATRKDAIKAYLYYKKNVAKMHKHFKIKLTVPCKREKEVEKETEKEKEKEAINVVDKKMEEMEDELEKLLS